MPKKGKTRAERRGTPHPMDPRRRIMENQDAIDKHNKQMEKILDKARKERTNRMKRSA